MSCFLTGAAADINADGKPDLVWGNVATGQNVVWFLDGITLVSQGTMPGVPDANWMIMRDKR